MKSTRDFLIEKLSYPELTVDDFYDTGVLKFLSRSAGQFLIHKIDLFCMGK